MRFFKRQPEPGESEHRSATQIYLDGGGDPANEGTMAILAEADRPMPPLPHRTTDVQDRPPVDANPLHAHEITASDAALIRAMSGASFGPEATVTLPSGRAITGAEMQLWLDAQDGAWTGHDHRRTHRRA